MTDTAIALRCNRCHRPMAGTTAYDGACECGGLIEAASTEKQKRLASDRWALKMTNAIRRDAGLPRRTLKEWRAIADKKRSDDAAQEEALRRQREATPDADVLELTAEMMLSAHLQPNFVRPSAARPPKQQWANWVKGWKPLSVQGKAAKRYSRQIPAPSNGYRYFESKKREYERWLAAEYERRAAA